MSSNEIVTQGSPPSLSAIDRGALPTADVVARFWSKVQKTSGCWLWRAGTNGVGYGMFYVDAKHPKALAHRVSYEWTHGPIAPGLFACHTCDTPGCVRPDHLFAGTNGDNVRDMYRKGRAGLEHKNFAHGERVTIHKLTEESVRRMRARRLEGCSYPQLGREFGVTHCAAMLAVKRITWKAVA
jgi:hypothetical protein